MSGLIQKLGQVALPVRDLNRPIAFYRDVLGLRFIWSNSNLAFFQMHETRLLLEIPEAPEFDHPGSVLYFAVADIDEAIHHLKDRGLAFDDDPHHIGDLGEVAVWMTFFHDTEGNVLALQCEQPTH